MIPPPAEEFMVDTAVRVATSHFSSVIPKDDPQLNPIHANHSTSRPRSWFVGELSAKSRSGRVPSNLPFRGPTNLIARKELKPPNR
mmetsp:Transcript_37202/g.68396  ORF Transcript_37202/g.68396 Transcript_37202/m.68396 type:complete len:86 (-) Transcript_37202:1304-1561(-)